MGNEVYTNKKYGDKVHYISFGSDLTIKKHKYNFVIWIS